VSDKALAYEMCDCTKCDRQKDCDYKGQYKRLPREFYIGALNLCPKIRNVRF
jgi:hypothetical protein